MIRALPMLRDLTADQRGATYSVSVLLILPVYIVSLVFAVELLFMANGYLALHASEESAVHAVRSWSSQRTSLQEHGSALDDAVHEAVLRSMIPFAPIGRPGERRDGSLDQALAASDLPPKAIERFGQKYAELQDLVAVEARPAIQTRGGFEINIRYEVPLYFKFFSPIFANQENSTGPARVLHAQRFVPLSRKQMMAADFGIPYSVREASQW